jgi:hypothetical protein
MFAKRIACTMGRVGVGLRSGFRHMSTNLPKPPRRFKWTKRIIIATGALFGITGVFSYMRLKQILVLKRFITSEEVDACRELAQKIIAEHDGNVTFTGVAALGPNMMVPFVPFALQRYADAGPDVRTKVQAEAAAEAQELIGAAFSRDKTRAMRAGTSFLLCFAYTPEEIEIIQSSEEAQKLLMKGVLLRSDQLRELRARQWGDSDGEGREGGESLGGGGGGEAGPWGTA